MVGRGRPAYAYICCRLVDDNPMHSTFSTENFHFLCDTVGSGDADLKAILAAYGYPPMWTRPNTFESLIHIILEQQVSLASALAALNKLREKIGKVTPERLLSLTDEELKACYFSRQKTVYARGLAQAIQENKFSLKALARLPNEDVRAKIVALKGLGNWSADIYLMFVLRRADIFPIGDLAAVNALRQAKRLSKQASSVDKVLKIAHAWQPYRTIATMILWHYYLSVRKKEPKALKEKVFLSESH
jgi:DNA-3-methyladenine glycosylase II